MKAKNRVFVPDEDFFELHSQSYGGEKDKIMEQKNHFRSLIKRLNQLDN